MNLKQTLFVDNAV